MILAACGGRLIERTDDDGEGATGSGGSNPGTGARPSGTAGTSSGGRATGTGGKATGSGGKATGTGGKATGVGGKATGTGGAGACSNFVCPDIKCGPGQVRVPTPDNCCFYCEGGCPPCPAIACGSGSHLEMVPGACCPTCVQDSCEAQRAGYTQFRQQLLDKYSQLGCMVDEDCTLYWEKNNCAINCGVAVPLAALNNLESNLQSYAQQNCSPNCMVPVPPCEPQQQPSCYKGYCE